MKRCAAVIAAACALLAPVNEGRALDRDRTLAQYHHTRWTAQTGAPQGVRRLAQTPDGWLWLGGTSGLYRFDGVDFERFRTAPGDEAAGEPVSTILADTAGNLWVAWMTGGVSRIDRQSNVARIDAGQKTALAFRTLEMDRGGTLWGLARSGLYRLSGETWQAVGAESGLPDGAQVDGIFCDEQGSVWVSLERAIHRLVPGSTRFVPVTTVPRDFRSWHVHDGGMWVSDASGLMQIPRPQHDRQGARELPGNRSSNTLIDLDNNLWTVFCDDGVCQRKLPAPLAGHAIAFDAPPRSMNRRDGLSSDIGMTVLEDRDGSIWVATQTGLDRFRNSRLVRVDLPTSMTNFRLAPADVDGTMLVSGAGARGTGLWRGKDAMVAQPTSWTQPTALLTTPRGETYLSSSEALWRLDRKSPVRIPWPSQAPRGGTPGIASDAQGVWIWAQGPGIWRWAGDRWDAPATPPLPAEQPSFMVADASGRMWFGYTANRVVALGDRVQEYGPAAGLDVGTVRLIAAGASVFVAGTNGVQMLVGERFQRLRVSSPELLHGVTGLVETVRGDVWMNGERGALYLPKAELDRFRSNPQSALEPVVLGTEEGHPGAAAAVLGQSSVVEAGDGRIWFAALDGVAWLDPKGARARLAEPRVIVRGIRAGGKSWPTDPQPTLPAGTQNVSLRYTALSLARAESVTFRVRLEGLETEWRNVGSTREVDYANLPPGRYTLHVQALAPGQAWPGAVAEQSFDIAPTFLQTVWFKLLCVLALVSLAFLAHHLRTRWMYARLNEHMQARMHERERIARELHDTLLQGVQGLTLTFHAIADSLPQGTPVRRKMDSSLERAEALVTEARDRVMELRSDGPLRTIDAPSMRAMAEELVAAREVDVVVDEVGHVRALEDDAAEAVWFIAREAVRNALAHANARALRIELQFERRAFALIVEDDGSGIDPNVAAHGKSGHWGLKGMHERARLVGGTLDVSPGEPRGTVVRLSIPASRAYRGRGGLEL